MLHRMILPVALCIAPMTTSCFGSQTRSWGNIVFADCPFTALAQGSHFTLGLCEDGTLQSWGEDVPGLELPADLGKVERIWAQGGVALAQTRSGKLIAWGDPKSPEGDILAIPKESGRLEYLWIERGHGYAMAIDTKGKLLTWGNLPNSLVPPKDLEPLRKVVVRGNSVIGLRVDGALRIWGGDTSFLSQISPDLGKFSDLWIGAGALVLRDTKGLIHVVGETRRNDDIPKVIENVLEVAAEERTLAFLFKDGKVLSTRTGKRSIPSLRGFGENLTHIFPGFATFLAIDAKGRFVTLDGPTMSVPFPSRGIREFHPFLEGGIVIRENGRLDSWGLDKATSMKLESLDSIEQITAGYGRILGLDRKGRVVCIGSDTGVVMRVPSDLPPIASIQISESDNFALDSAGNLFWWGYGFLMEPPKPARKYTRIIASAKSVMAVQADGKPTIWGSYFVDLPQEVMALRGRDIAKLGFSHCVLEPSDSLRCHRRERGKSVLSVPMSGILSIKHGGREYLFQERSGRWRSFRNEPNSATKILNGPGKLCKFQLGYDYGIAVFEP